jgi:hypothetical protein
MNSPFNFARVSTKSTPYGNFAAVPDLRPDRAARAKQADAAQWNGANETKWRNYRDCGVAEAARTAKIEEVRSPASNPNNKAMQSRLQQFMRKATANGIAE